MTTVDYIELMNGRESYYRFLAEIYKIEISPKMLESLKELDYSAFSDTAMKEGYGLIKKYLESAPVDPLTDLAVDYARVLLGAGIVEKEKISAPYASVYTSQERLIMQEARDEALRYYRENGLDRVKGFDVPEDHIAIELEFMAHLCAETVKAYEKNNTAEASRLIGVQKSFLNNHMLKWCPQFCVEVMTFARTDFYRGVASVTESFLRTDKDLLNDMAG